MLYNVNFRLLAFQLHTWFLRGSKLLRILFSWLKPLKQINNDGVLVRSFGQSNPSLFQFQRFILDFLNFDARTIYLQKWLNNYYDAFLQRIEIVNNNSLPILYIFNDIESKPPFFVYNDWDSTISYNASPEDYAFLDRFVFAAIVDNTNLIPPNSSWLISQDIQYIYNDGESTGPDYEVRVPIVVQLQPFFTIDRITSQINLFNAAGRTFIIQIV